MWVIHEEKKHEGTNSGVLSAATRPAASPMARRAALAEKCMLDECG